MSSCPIHSDEPHIADLVCLVLRRFPPKSPRRLGRFPCSPRGLVEMLDRGYIGESLAAGLLAVVQVSKYGIVNGMDAMILWHPDPAAGPFGCFQVFSTEP